ncbi:MAG: flagellar basal body rod protein FlgC [Cyanobacteriota bacterium]
MDFNTLNINASALTAQRMRMDTIASNLANANSTRKSDGTLGAYRRREVVFAPILNQAMEGGSAIGSNFNGANLAAETAVNPSVSGVEFNSSGRPLIKGGISINEGVLGQGVQVVNIVEDTENPTRVIYNPGHPDADENGYVEMPNINVVNEMVDMISATRAYEANLSVVQNFKNMYKATLRI